MLILTYNPKTENLKDLANAVIMEAISEARRGELSRIDFVAFVNSDYFYLLSRGSVDPQKIIAEVFEDVNKSNF